MKVIIFLVLVVVVFKWPAIMGYLGRLRRFVYWKYRDFKERMRLKKLGIIPFTEFGLKMFTGRQGSGKTVGMVYRLEKLRKKYPDADIYTNFQYIHQTGPLLSLNDLLTKRNGEKGVIFAIDEIQNEFSSMTSKDFPESLLSTVTMQRKQRIVILASSQVFTRVSKPLREQCFEVIECKTYFGRWTVLKAFDADDYNLILDSNNPDVRLKLRKVWRLSFIQNNYIRELYDTYQVVQRLSRTGFVPKLTAPG